MKRVVGTVEVYSLYVIVNGKKLWYTGFPIANFVLDWSKRHEASREEAISDMHYAQMMSRDPICYDEKVTRKDLKKMKMVKITKSRIVQE